MARASKFPQFDFLRESIKNLRTTGSVAPSSKFLCKKIADKIDPLKADVVVELGPGDGVITRFILERLRPDSELLIFEINDVFVQKIRNRFSDPRLTLIHDSAETMGLHFKERNIESVDYIVSGIPFTMLPDVLAESIITKSRDWLKPGGRFVQFHYSPLLLNLYRRIFDRVYIDMVPLNVPPALVITGEKF